MLGGQGDREQEEITEQKELKLENKNSKICNRPGVAGAVLQSPP